MSNKSDKALFSAIQKYLKDNEKKIIDLAMNNAKTKGVLMENAKRVAEREANRLIGILRAYFPPRYYEDIDHLVKSEARQRGEDEFVVEIDFDASAMRRPSIYPEGYPEGLTNIAKLLSTGYTNTGNLAYGVMNGKRVYMPRVFKSDPFLELAVNEFNGTAPDGVFANLDKSYTDYRAPHRTSFER